MSLIGAYFCVILAKSIPLFVICSDYFFQHFKAEHWEFTLHMLNEHIYLSPTVCIEGNTNRLRVMSQYQTEKFALFFILFFFRHYSMFCALCGLFAGFLRALRAFLHALRAFLHASLVIF